MKFNEAIFQSYGMLKEHVKAIEEAVKDSGTPVMFRSVSRFATHWIKQGYPSKDFSIKNKSAKVGPAAGLIVIDPQFSHIEPIDYEAHVDNLDQAMHQAKQLTKIQLALTDDRIKQLVEAKCIECKKDPDNAENYILTWDKMDKAKPEAEAKLSFTAYAIKDGKQFKIYFKDKEEKLKPIEVLAKEIQYANQTVVSKPITADYDLFGVLPSYKNLNNPKMKKVEIKSESDSSPKTESKLESKPEPEYYLAYSNNEDHRPFRVQGNTHVNKNQVKEDKLYNDFLKVSSLSTRNQKRVAHLRQRPMEEAGKGNVSPRVNTLLKKINRKIALRDTNRDDKTAALDLQMVHHNDEMHNPFADNLEASLPILLILPHAIHFDNAPQTLILLESVSDVQLARERLQQAGYYWETQAKHKADLPAFNPAQLKAAQAATGKIITKLKTIQQTLHFEHKALSLEVVQENTLMMTLTEEHAKLQQQLAMFQAKNTTDEKSIQDDLLAEIRSQIDTVSNKLEKSKIRINHLTSAIQIIEEEKQKMTELQEIELKRIEKEFEKLEEQSSTSKTVLKRFNTASSPLPSPTVSPTPLELKEATAVGEMLNKLLKDETKKNYTDIRSQRKPILATAIEEVKNINDISDLIKLLTQIKAKLEPIDMAKEKQSTATTNIKNFIKSLNKINSPHLEKSLFNLLGKASATLNKSTSTPTLDQSATSTSTSQSTDAEDLMSSPKPGKSFQFTKDK